MKKYMLFLFFLAIPALICAQAIEYRRNGECYLLIGHNDPVFRGVYRLNNPSGEPDGNPVNVKLFDPRTSYGISVNLDRMVYTFSENKAPTFTLGDWKLERLMKKPGGVGLWGAHCDTRENYYVSTENLTHNQAGRPVYTTTGPMGGKAENLSDDPQNVCWDWSGVVKPTIKEAGRWYFQKTVNLCDNDCIYTNGLNDAFWLYFVPVDGAGYGKIPNNSWWQSRDPDPSGRPGNLFYWDRVYRKYTYYNLNYWNKPLGIWSAGSPVYSQDAGVADSIFDEIVKRSRISACLNCVCVNGSGDQDFSAKPKFISLAMSPFGRMYLYSRTQTSSSDGEIRMNGTAVPPASANIRGNVNEVTTEWVGISALGKSEDFIYLLGTALIKEWLLKFNIKPATLNIKSVAVSDQWWLEGGIVYAYDADEGAAYQFIRNDKGGSNTCKSTPQKINIGKGVDAIKADGNGDLYFAKTTMDPVSTSKLDWEHFYDFYFYQTYGGRAYGYVLYRQAVYKTVFCQKLGDTASTQIGHVQIGNNLFRRAFNVPASESASTVKGNIQSKAGNPWWVWQGGYQQTAVVSDPSLVQLGVINVARPPVMVKPNGELGVVDIVGVEDSQPGFKFLSDEVNQGMYTFRVENQPYWEGRNNIATPGKTRWEGDKNNNGREGGFVSSLMNTSEMNDSSPEVLYTWRIYKIQDAFGNPPAEGPQLVKEFVDSIGSGLMYYFRSGVYQIMCSAKFKYYDYDTLPFGSTVEDINNCIRPSLGMQQAKNVPIDPGINATLFPGLKLPIPADTAVTLLKVNRQLPPPTGKKVDIQVKEAGVWKDPKVLGTSKYHVVKEDLEYEWRLKGDPKDPASKYLQDLYNLPNITNSNMVPNTLGWAKNMAVQYEWTLNLTLPDGTVYPAQELSKASWLPTDAPIKLKQEFPTDPVMGRLVCKAYREWEYMENQYEDDGSYKGQKRISDTIEYSGEVEVLVIDQTAPKIIAVNGKKLTGVPISPIYLGETGGLVTQGLSHGGYTNPASFSILVEDNNIYANMAAVAPVAATDRLHNRGTNQTATFFFERGSGKEIFPKNLVTATYAGTAEDKHYSSPGLSTVADITTAWTPNLTYKVMRKPQPYKSGDTSSYVLYVFNVSDWDHLQNGVAGDFMTDPGRWPIDMANNSPTYNSPGALIANHPGYGLMFQAVDSSGFQSVRMHLGNVWVRDTLLPMVYSQTVDYIKSFDELQPFDIAKYLVKNPWKAETGFPWYGKLPNDLSLWEVKADGRYPSLNDLMGIPCGLKAKLAGAYHPPIIQEGMEIFMEARASDNIKVSDTVVPTITVNGPTGLYSEGTPAQISENSGTTQKVRLLLQKSGVYDVTLTAEDNAMDFAGKAAPNKRTVKFGIVVGPATMEIRVLDKKNSNF